MKPSEVTKPTFSAVGGAQLKLQSFIEDLIEQNIPIPKDKRSIFITLLASSTCGLGSYKPFTILIENNIYHAGNVESFARWLSIQDTNKVSIPPDYGNRGSPEKDIKIYWQKLLELLFFIFPISLDRALSMSREDARETKNDSKQHRVGEKYG